MDKPKFNISERVYHVTSETKFGVVIDIRYSYLTKLHEYQVSFDYGVCSLWYTDFELSQIPNFN